ncbi:MAG TPA: lysophospholipid acyltransferase family protein [Candidatus Angelobacter sp.]|nr:lysophospholipid acyltransferase family protein [Candidatus Angelobacter sp.]
MQLLDPPMKTMPASLPKRILRVVLRGTGLAWGIVACLSEYLLRRLAGRLPEQTRIEVLHRWSRWTLARMAITVAVKGSPPSTGLIASNHLSYLDIIVHSAVAPCAFVSKREVRRWPGVGWIATLAGTIYVDRSRRSETHAIQPEIQSALASGLRLVLFPEGTSSDGSGLLRFHSSLFQPAVDLQAPVSAASIAYAVSGGIAGTEACWWGNMPLFPHLIKLLSKDSVTATVGFSTDSFRFTDRKQAALQMHQQVDQLRNAAVAVAK